MILGGSILEHIDFRYSNSLIDILEIDNMDKLIENVHESLCKKECQGSEFLGWIDYPLRYDIDEVNRILSVAEEIKNNSDILIVIGIGGSYLGARAAIEFNNNIFSNYLNNQESRTTKVFFAGNNLSANYIAQLIEVVKDKSFSICVISKSGKTTEPAIAFRVFKNLLETKYGKHEASKRIISITDAKEGALRDLANKEGYVSFSIPKDIGGRYSVLTPVGLFPMAVAGIDINEVLKGAKDASVEYDNPKLSENKCYQYAAIRNILGRKGKDIEVLGYFEPAFQYFAEWWKQLYGESECKDGKGIFPASLLYTTDLHSMGQLMQEGRRNMFETIIRFNKIDSSLILEEDEENIDGLNYLSGKTIDYINKIAVEATCSAHRDGGVPVLEIDVPELSAYSFGQLAYFFQKSCAVSCCLLDVNPFTQPGVEAYKKNMLDLLRKA